MNTSQKSDIGIIGLSVMGRSLALNMADHGFKVSGYNRSASVTEQVMEEHPHKNLFPFYSLEELIDQLAWRRCVMPHTSDIPARPAIPALTNITAST